MRAYFLHHGDCLEVMPKLAPNSIDSIVTDPPYGLSFMGKDWDHGVPGVPFWTEALRVAKPGAYLLAFGGSRTYHRLACAIEDAGWEVRDCIMWLYGSGFPKSHNLQGKHKGWGTALKPAHEPIIMARKPLIGTVAANVQAHGTGAINVDGCRVELANGEDISVERNDAVPLDTAKMGWGFKAVSRGTQGRWPANVIHDGSEEVVGLFPVTGASQQRTGKRSGKSIGRLGAFSGQDTVVMGHNDTGSAARFFYCAKASKADRDEGLVGFKPEQVNDGRDTSIDNAYQRGDTLRKNTHPTVKPTALMRYLCRLVTPTGGTVLDPFMGSGTTGVACVKLNRNFIGMEISQEYLHIAESRINA
jgi:site-specific DNA-methyltransferase (adenine-specific)